MSYWLTVKQMSEKYGVSDVTVRHWVERGYITCSKINAVTLVDEDSFKPRLEAHKRPGMSEEYLERMVREKQEEIDHVLAGYDDWLFLLRTQKDQRALFRLIIKSLANLIVDPLASDVFFSVSVGAPIEDVARFHCLTYDQTVSLYEKTLSQLLQKSLPSTPSALPQRPADGG